MVHLSPDGVLCGGGRRVGAAWAWGRAEWRRRAAALVLLAVLIGLLAAATLTAVAGARRTETAYERFRDATRAWDARVQLDGSEDGLPEPGDLAPLADLPGVIAAGEVQIFPAFSDYESDFDIGVFVPVDGVWGAEVDQPRLLSGRLPNPSRSNEVLANEGAAAQLGVGVGDRVTLRTLSPAQMEMILSEEGDFAEPEGPELDLVVVGIGRAADDLVGDEANVTLMATPAFGETYREDAANFSGMSAVLLAGGTAALDDFRQVVRDAFGEGAEVRVEGADQQAAEISDATSVLATGLLLVALSAGLVAVVVGGQALGRQLRASGDDDYALAALGMARHERTAGLVVVSAPVAGLAAVIAVSGAFLLSALTPISIARRAEPDPGMHFDFIVLPAGAALTLLLVLAGAAAIGWRLSRPAVVDPAPVATRGIAARAAAALRAGPAWTVGLRLALGTREQRTGFTARSAVAGIVVGLAGVTAAVVFAGSVDRLVDSPERYGFNWDLSPDLFDEHLDEVVALDEVGAAALIPNQAVSVNGRPLRGYALDVRKGSLDFTYIDGRPPTGPGEIALGPAALARLGVDQEDTVVVGESEVEVTIVGTVLVPSVDDDPYDGGAVLTGELLESVAESEGFSAVAIKWAPGVSRERGEAALSEQFPFAISAYSRPRPPVDIVNVERTGGLVRALALFLGIVAVAAAFHSLATSARRRRGDLALLRSLGFVRRQVVGSTVAHGLILSSLGVLVGLPLGLAAGRWIWRLIAGSLGVAADPVVPLGVIAVLVGATVAFTAVLAVPLGFRSLRRVPALDLRVE